MGARRVVPARASRRVRTFVRSRVARFVSSRVAFRFRVCVFVCLFVSLFVFGFVFSFRRVSFCVFRFSCFVLFVRLFDVVGGR